MDRSSPFSRARAPRALLVVRLGAVGDVVRTLPAVRLLRRTWPSARLGWAVEPAGASLIAGHPDVDEIIVLKRRELAAAGRRLDLGAYSLAGGFVRALRALGPELSIDFQGNFKSGVVARLSGASVRVGYERAQSREWSHVFANVRFVLDEPRVSRVMRAAALARAAGADDGPLEASLALSPGERAEGRERLGRLVARRPVVSLAPFSSARQSWKRYPLDGWAEVSSGLARDGAGVLVLCGPGEEDEARALCRRAGDGVVSSGPIGLRPLAALIAATDLFVGGDTGPMHIAWSCGVPCIAVYGPTDPVINAPFGRGHVVLAPDRPTGRHDLDRFPGIGHGTILSTARRRLRELRAGSAETRT